jgi:dipeptidyl aminopeptidase/acylaminoacyl peptidase
MKVRSLAVGAALAALFLAAAPLFAAAKHPFTYDDVAMLRSASARAISPDGRTVLSHVRVGAEKGPDKYEWHLISVDGRQDRKLDLPEHFEPMGFARGGAALYGALPVKDVPQLAIVAIQSSGPVLTVLTDLPRGIGAARLSPDGSKFAVLADPRPADPLDKVRTVIAAPQTSLYEVSSGGAAGSWMCPTLVHVADMAWSADSRRVALLSNTPKIGYHYLHSFLDVCDSAGIHHIADIPNAAAGVAWANGGRDLAFLSTTTSVLTPDHLWTVPAAGGAPVDRTPDLKGSALGLAPDAHGVAWLLIVRGVRNEIDSYRDARLQLAFRWPAGIIESTPVSPDLAVAPDALAFTVGDPQHTPNVAVPEANGKDLRKITSEGDSHLADVELGDVRIVHWTSKEGIPLEGIVTFPAGYQPGRKYPFLVLPHGGPEANDTFRFDDFARLIAGFGYVVLQPEYRGSTGYGSDFLNAIYQHFGDRAYRDVDSATDFALAQGWADPARLAIFGWSAGGFMTSWTVTQTHRYRAAIEGAGITDWGSFMWTSDVQQFDYDARWPDEDPAAFQKFSAVMFAKNVTTPLLILHGAADTRVPTYQGREYFELLDARGKTVRMVTYPGSNHFPRLEEQRRDIFQEISSWLKKYNP